MKNNFISIVILLLLITGGISVFFIFSGESSFNKQHPAESESKDTETDFSSEESAPRLIIGDKEAPVTIIEYSDFQCPFCLKFFEDTEPEIRSAYIEEGLVNIDYRPEVHIGEESIIAAEGAYCAADQDGFEPYHKAVFSNRGNGALDPITDQALTHVADEIGLNKKSFNECLTDDSYRSAVLASHQKAHEEVGISGTPTFLIGNRRIAGAQPFSVFKPLIDEELSRTR